MVFFETLVMVHGRFPASETKLLMREATRVIVERDGALFRILDLGWRHTAKPLHKKGVGHIFYGRWYSLIWGGSPKVKREVEDTFVHNTGVVRQLTVPIERPEQMYVPRSTYYPLIKPLTPPLTHHVPMPDVGRK
mmetsp:Transcript_1766/g.3177  ORF Transcript_1766/g.3177 Transcript_1766/m.3177 type:complete len:135 (-) Transcript_1766:34-438(-)